MDDEVFSLLTGSPTSRLGRRGSFEHDIQDGRVERKLFAQRPIISWRTQPSFEIAIDFHEIGRYLVPILLAFLPSFIFYKKPRKLSPTSYLDGLRGVASFFVVIHHYCIAYTVSSQIGYHRGGEGENDWFFLRPIIRVVHSGRFMVMIFFVISGYVLSYRSLLLAREGKYIELFNSLGSSVFRRWLRLHLPVIASTFIAFLLCRQQLWADLPYGWEHFVNATHIAVNATPLPIPIGNFTMQLYDWAADSRQLCDPFLYGALAVSRYNIGILWTIPVEFMGSMLVFATVLGLARAKPWVKICSLTGLVYWAHCRTRWEPATFLTGILLAELSFCYSRPLSPSPTVALNEKEIDPIPASSFLRMISNCFFTCLLVFSIYIGSHPQDGAGETPGYIDLMSYLPEQYAKDLNVLNIYFLSIGASLLVLSLENAPYLQRPFTTPIAQYLGDISFSLYLLHCEVLYTLGQWLVPKCMNITGGWANGQLGFVGGMGLAICVLGPFTIWASDVFSTVVDKKCVRFARWVSKKCFV